MIHGIEYFVNSIHFVVELILDPEEGIWRGSFYIFSVMAVYLISGYVALFRTEQIGGLIIPKGTESPRGIDLSKEDLLEAAFGLTGMIAILYSVPVIFAYIVDYVYFADHKEGQIWFTGLTKINFLKSCFTSFLGFLLIRNSRMLSLKIFGIGKKYD